MERYNFKVVEKKWQKFWDKNKTFKAKINKDDCNIVKVDSTLGQEIKLAILKKAAVMKKTEQPNIEYPPKGIIE